MDKNQLLFVVGARPNFIKIAPVCSVLENYPNLSYKVVHTGQHYDWLMSDIFFQELDIPEPDFHLNVGSGPHGQQTGAVMTRLEKICMEHKFSSLIVFGDVNSTLAGALVGAKLNIPVAHVEAGLRSFNRHMPEEINRIATDHVSEWLFAPSRLAMENLQREGLQDRSYFSGDVMYDMMLRGIEMAKDESNILSTLKVEPKSYFLVTLHRPYNVDDPAVLTEIFAALSQLEQKVILPAHPRLRKNLNRFGIKAGDNVQMTEPFGYLDFVTLEKNAHRIITDSGGIQKEAFFLQTPCITLRPETEWTETVAAGANVLVKTRTSQAILEAAGSDLTPSYQEQPYGNGRAGQIIVETIQSQLRPKQLSAAGVPIPG
jgi:UDP-GlcNAc3NAcA epimerase